MQDMSILARQGGLEARASPICPLGRDLVGLLREGGGDEVLNGCLWVIG